MSSLMQKRMYDMEIVPPNQVWDQVSAALNEINADNRLAEKLSQSAVDPAPGTWEKISYALNPAADQYPKGSVKMFPWKQLAAAAVVIGIILSVYFFSGSSSETTLPTVSSGMEQPDIKTGLPVTEQPPAEVPADQKNISNETSPVKPVFASRNLKSAEEKRKENEVVRKVPVSATFVASTESINKKSFNKPIDDLSLITANDDYYTMVNANGRMTKIPARLVELAPYLQDKPIVHDYYEQMIGEGAYWKEKLKDWQKKISENPKVSSGNSFFDMIDLFKAVESK